MAGMKDWADDETLSSDEVLKRFLALNPAPTTGPSFRGGMWVARAAMNRLHGNGHLGIGMQIRREVR